MCEQGSPFNKRFSSEKGASLPNSRKRAGIATALFFITTIGTGGRREMTMTTTDGAGRLAFSYKY